MSGWRVSRTSRTNRARRTSRTIVAALGGAAILAGCGGGQRLDANEPTGKYTVEVPNATFPSAQTLSQHSHLVLVVRNASNKPMPNVSVTICNVTCSYPAPPGEGTSAQPFGATIDVTGVANPSRPVWVVDRPPGPCSGTSGYSCASGGAGGYVTSSPNVWAIGHSLAPGASVKFDWALTAVTPGTHTVAWQVDAGLNGKARAVLSDGTAPHGTFTVSVSRKPVQSYVNNNGQIVTQP